MAEFEQFDDNATPLEWMLPDGRPLPPDFTADEVSLAQSFNDHFDIAGENLPPRYAQTLLGDPRHAPASDDFEERMISGVFQALHLERPHTPLAPHPLRKGRQHVQRLLQRVAQRGAVAVMALMMVFAYNATGTGVALASVLQIITGHGGASAVTSYPSHVTAGGQGTNGAMSAVSFTPRWPGTQTHEYTFTGIDLINGQWWTQGALVMLHYTNSDGNTLHHLDIMEFVPRVHVALQVVQEGSMSLVKIGDADGAFVWGHWAYQPKQGMVWIPSQRAELIYGGADAASPVIWIAADDLGDQSVAQMQATLMDVAGSLQLMRPLRWQRVGQHAGDIPINQVSDIAPPFRDDVIALVPDRSDPQAPVIDVRVGPDPLETSQLASQTNR